MIEKSDEKLVADYINGDKESLEILIKRYLKPIYSFIYRYINSASDTEDITQEVFVRVWRNIKRFDKEKSFKTWIFSIAKNASIDFFKKKKPILFSEFESEDGSNFVLDKLTHPIDYFSKISQSVDASRIISNAIRKISPEYRMVLFLRYNDHFTFKEIAESLGEPIHTIKSRHRRALIMLKKIVSGLSDK